MTAYWACAKVDATKDGQASTVRLVSRSLLPFFLLFFFFSARFVLFYHFTTEYRYTFFFLFAQGWKSLLSLSFEFFQFALVTVMVDWALKLSFFFLFFFFFIFFIFFFLLTLCR